MNNRNYNILYHTHTISGIVISAVLYVIFFAGSFSFFRDEFVNWERNHSQHTHQALEIDLNTALDSLSLQQNLYSRDIAITKYYEEQRVSFTISGSKDTIVNPHKNQDFFYLDTQNFTQHTYNDSYTLGEFLYRLHFLAQIPYPYGYYLSGFIAFFFLFAIITGIIIHWDKFIKNFYTFRPKVKLKTLWTDAHTALGTIGLPFQFVYAVTGAFFMIKLVLIAPSIAFMYDGDQEKFYSDLGYEHQHYEFNSVPLNKAIDFNQYIHKAQEKWNGFKVTQLHIFNYGDTNMHLLLEGHLDFDQKLNGIGEITYHLASGKIVDFKDPTQKTSYLDAVKNLLYRLHYGDYGGFTLRVISFVLGLISCFVIISGVMIWLVARDKKNIPLKKRKFNEALVQVYLAVCLSMYPITSLSFIAVKVWHPVSKNFIFNFYFIGWLVLSLIFILKKDFKFTHKATLISGSVIGFFIPIVNGITTNNWLWSSYKNNQFDIFMVDLFWIILSGIGLYVAKQLKSKA